MSDDLIREIEAAAILGVSHQRVNQLRTEAKLSVVRRPAWDMRASCTGAPTLSASVSSAESDAPV